MKRFALFGLAAATVLAVAQLGSYLVNSRLPIGETHAINGVLHLTHVRNTGAVFGLFPGTGMVFAATSGITMVGFLIYVIKKPALRPYQYVCFGLISGAAAANMCDRFIYGSVVDFIDIQGIPHWNYVFNIADSAIHLGAWPLVLGTLGRKDTRRPGSEVHLSSTE